MDEPRACYTGWSKSERKKLILYINTYKCNLDRWYLWTYLQGSNGYADIGNTFVDTPGEGDGGINREISMEAYTLLYVKLDSQCEFAVCCSQLNSNALRQPRGLGWGVR